MYNSIRTQPIVQQIDLRGYLKRADSRQQSPESGLSIFPIRNLPVSSSNPAGSRMPLSNLCSALCPVRLRIPSTVFQRVGLSKISFPLERVCSSRDAKLPLDSQAGKSAIFHGDRRCAGGELAAEFGAVLCLVVPDAYFFVVSGNRKTNRGDGIANCVSNSDLLTNGTNGAARKDIEP